MQVQGEVGKVSPKPSRLAILRSWHPWSNRALKIPPAGLIITPMHTAWQRRRLRVVASILPLFLFPDRALRDIARRSVSGP